MKCISDPVQRSGDSRKRGEPTSGLGNELPRSAPERAASQVLRPASLASRLGALLYEAVLLLAMAFIGAFALLPLISPAGADRSTLSIPPVFARTMMFCALAGGAALYYTWCWSEGRRTLPQKTWRLRLVDCNEHPLTRKLALLRYGAAWIGPLCALAASMLLRPVRYAPFAAALLLLNYAWALIDREKQFLHDRIARTRVVRDR